MSLINFRPEVFSKYLLDHLDKDHVYADLCNRKYEEEIALNGGDTARIFQTGEINVTDYTGSAVSPQTVTGAETVFTIDQTATFNFQIQNLDAELANLADPIGEYLQRAAYQTAEKIDKYVASVGVAGAGLHAYSGDTIQVVTSSNFLTLLTIMGQRMDEANVPKNGRWIVLPPFMNTKMVLAKLPLTTMNEDLITNGRIIRFAGFDIRISNNVPNDAQATPTYQILAGTPQSITYAERFKEMKAVDLAPTGVFSDAVMGLVLYGARVLQPQTLCVAYVQEGTES